LNKAPSVSAADESRSVVSQYHFSLWNLFLFCRNNYICM
jgi:hypothetical protein